MKGKLVGKWTSAAALVCAAVWLSSLSSCARNQQLQGISITPSGFTYGSPVPTGVTQTAVPLIAYGSYIHPPQTKNITNSVIWASDLPAVAAVDSTGGLTAGAGCGVANISASVYTDNGNPNGNVVVGYMSVTVDGPASEGCPTGTETQNLSVDVTNGAADGTIVSAPAGINCGVTCSATFPTASTITLTETPNNGQTFLGWASGCTSSAGNTCNVTLNSDVIVSASFN